MSENRIEAIIRRAASLARMGGLFDPPGPDTYEGEAQPLESPGTSTAREVPDNYWRGKEARRVMRLSMSACGTDPVEARQRYRHTIWQYVVLVTVAFCLSFAIGWLLY